MSIFIATPTIGGTVYLGYVNTLVRLIEYLHSEAIPESQQGADVIWPSKREVNHHGEQGILFDSWREVAPFILFGGFPLLVLLFGLLVRTRIKPLPKLI